MPLKPLKQPSLLRDHITYTQALRTSFEFRFLTQTKVSRYRQELQRLQHQQHQPHQQGLADQLTS